MGSAQIVVNLGRNGLAEKLARWDTLVMQGAVVVDKVANESLGRLVNATPIRYKGNVRKQWVHRIVSPMAHVNENPSKVMGWLEHGTKAHGPKTAKALFIPLNEKTGDLGPRLVMEANAQARATGQWNNYATRAAGGRGRPVRLPFVFGVDFLWAKKVKGIKARHIARDEQKLVTRELRAGLVSMLKRELG
jgi:hypothetical protein